jgi:cysteine desulfurase
VSNHIYLDNNASTPIDPRVKDLMMQWIDNPINPSYQAAFEASIVQDLKMAMQKAKQQLSDLIQAQKDSIIWTSGATESNNLAIKGACAFYKRHGRHIISTETEHSSTLETCKHLEKNGFELTLLKPDAKGKYSIEKVKNALRKDTILLSMAHVNNEIGVIQDIESISNTLKENNIIFHVDAAQSLGKIKIDLEACKIDLLSVSSHKIYGPKGIGALYCRNKPKVQLFPLIHGGGQQLNRRSGTLPAFLIIGFGAACEIAAGSMQEDYNKCLHFQKICKKALQHLPAKINGCQVDRIPHNLNFYLPDVHPQALDYFCQKIIFSHGSSCKAGFSQPSHVLQAMQMPIHRSSNSIRFGFGRFNTETEVKEAINQIKEAYLKLRSYAPGWEENE